MPKPQIPFLLENNALMRERSRRSDPGRLDLYQLVQSQVYRIVHLAPMTSPGEKAHAHRLRIKLLDEIDFFLGYYGNSRGWVPNLD